MISETMRHTRALECLKSMRYKAIVHWILSTFTHPHSTPKLYDFLSFCGTQKKIFWKTFIVWTEKQWNIFQNIFCVLQKKESLEQQFWNNVRFLGKLCCLRDRCDIIYDFCHVSMVWERTKKSSVRLWCPSWVSATPDVMPQNQSRCQSRGALQKPDIYHVYGPRKESFPPHVFTALQTLHLPSTHAHIA